MEKRLIEKMIRQCFKQYYEGDSLPLWEDEMTELIGQILRVKAEEPGMDLYEVVNDVVYEFLASVCTRILHA